MMVKSIMVLAPCAEADRLAARFVRALHEQFPAWYVSAVGGESLRGAGAEVFLDYPLLNQTKFLRGFSHFSHFASAHHQIKRRFFMNRPDVLILMGCSPSNLSLAHYAKRQGIKVIAMMMPKTCELNAKQLLHLRRVVDHVATVYPHLQQLLRDNTIPATYVGSPIMQEGVIPLSYEQAREALSLYQKQTLVAMLPGNTMTEVRRLLPLMLHVARRRPQYRFVLALAPTISKEAIKRYKDQLRELNVWIVKDQTEIVIKACDAALCADGRATLEVAINDVPMIVVSKSSRNALCNLVSGGRVAPELRGHRANSREIAENLDRLLSAGNHAIMRQGYEAIRKQLNCSYSVGDNMAAVVSEHVTPDKEVLDNPYASIFGR